MPDFFRYNPRVLSPLGQAPAAAAVCTAVSNSSYFVYVGPAPYTFTTCNILAKVTTLVATITWAEIGVFTGTFVGNSAAILTRVGFTDVSAIYNTTGIKRTAVTTTGILPGDDLWIAYGSQATTPFVLRGNVADDTQCGVFQSKAATRISTVAASTSMGVEAAASISAQIRLELP